MKIKSYIMTPRIRASPKHSVKDFSIGNRHGSTLFWGGVIIVGERETIPVSYHYYDFQRKYFLKNLNVHRDFHPNRFVLSQNAILPEQMIFIIALNTGAV